MPTTDHPTPSLGKLVSSWLSLTGWIFATCLARAQHQTEKVGQAVKDTILDLGTGPADADRAGPQPLAALDPEAFVAGMRGRVEEILHRVAEMLNEDPCGCWTEVTEERVLALFAELAQEALAQALELRVAAEEARLQNQLGSSGEWVKKFRRMLAAEGRWPPEQQE